MSFPYRKVLMTGATSGIGKALTTRLASNGVHVIATGRRTENLKALQNEYGADKITIMTVDVSDLGSINKVVEDVTKQHPDLDCVFMNAGMQRGMNFKEPETVDMSVMQEELNTNYTSVVAMTLAFLPFLQAQKEKTTSSALAVIPLVRCAGYSATKAALHAFILCLRQQLKSSNVKVVELLPPAVQTELHDEKYQPDIKNGREIGVPLDTFTDGAYSGLCEGKEQIFVHVPQPLQDVEAKRGEVFANLVKKWGGGD
ncbi:MAG: hypothetical protein MMC23_005573 [Stictis urceolatum]|nr:hypothetical protein [Stictis urceolata]